MYGVLQYMGNGLTESPEKHPAHPQLGWHWFHQGGSRVSIRGPAGLSVLSSSSSRHLVFVPVLRSHCFQKQLPHGAQFRDEEARRAGSFLPTPRLLALNQAVKVKVTQSFLLFETPWTIQSLEFSRPEYWSG